MKSDQIRQWRRILGGLAMVFLLSSCAETQFLISTAKRVNKSAEPSAEGGTQGYYKVGKPYQIQGIWYYPEEDYSYDETGIASWYGAKFHGRNTANGEVYDMNALTAAHRTLPMPSFVRVTNLENGRALVLTINDRGPFAKGRIIDISRRGAQLLGFQRQGTARVRVQILADKSRGVAMRMKNRDELARVGSPITVDKLPKATVSAEALPAPAGAASSPETTLSPPLPSPTPASAAQPAQPVRVASADLRSNDPILSQESVKPTSIYVQAGAFGIFENANKVRARLTPMGNVFMDRVLVSGRDLFRVRLGPLSDVGVADEILSQVIATGFRDARIIVDEVP